MKNCFCSILFILTVFFIPCQAQEAAAEIKTNYAVMNLKCGDGVSEGEGELISDRLRSELFNTGKVNVMERNQMQEVLKEQGFQQSGACTDEACVVEMGQMLGVKVMVVGSLGKLGSMFMVNIRAIDVQTARIIKVVSVDVKGDIEDVVDHLWDIAVKITSEKSDGIEKRGGGITGKVKEIARNLTDDEDEEQEVSEKEKEENEEPEKIVVEVKKEDDEDDEDDDDDDDDDDSNTDRNRNRFGVGFTFNLYGYVSHVNDLGYEEYIYLYDGYDDEYTTIDDYYYTKDAFPTIDFLVRFYIRAGSYLSFEIGPHFIYTEETYSQGDSYLGDSELFIAYFVPGLHTGISFVKRIYPLKINAGAFVNFTMPIASYSFDGYDDAGYSEYDDDVAVRFRPVPGVRTGAEILLGDRFGFSVDFVFQWLKFDIDFDFDELDIDGYDDSYYYQEVYFPAVGVGLGANIYF